MRDLLATVGAITLGVMAISFIYGVISGALAAIDMRRNEVELAKRMRDRFNQNQAELATSELIDWARSRAN
jgi:precorrin-6B methylase 2